MMQRIQGLIEESNTAVETAAAALYQQLDDPAAARLAVPWSWIAGSFSLSGAHVLTQRPGQPTLFRSLGLTVESPGGESLRIDGTDALELDGAALGLESPRFAALPLSAEALQRNADGTFDISAGGVRATHVRLREHAGADGRTWMIPAEAS
jgi:hypothetical protein